ncbi:MAG: hypothetical protein V1774_12410 [Candidatus Eisenbacteria bacterium]
MAGWNALGQDVLVMGAALAVILVVMLLVTFRRASPGWARAGRLAVIALALGGLGAWQYFVRQERDYRESRAREVISLVSIEKQTDAVSMFEDIVRIRFRYRNLSRQAVSAFNASFQVRDAEGGSLINDQLSISASIQPGATASWMVKYWATCPQDFTPKQWEALVNQDIGDFEIEWYADGLVFEDGTTIR